MPAGRVVSFDDARGLGEIEDHDGRRYGFHCAEIADGSRIVSEGTRVEFEVRAGLPGHWEACRVEKR